MEKANPIKAVPEEALFRYQQENFMVRNTDPETSSEAAKFARKAASRGCIKALEALSMAPMTDYDLASATGLQQNSIGKRRSDCANAKLVRDCVDADGLPVKKKAPSGANCIVWEITTAGRSFLRAYHERLAQK